MRRVQQDNKRSGDSNCTEDALMHLHLDAIDVDRYGNMLNAYKLLCCAVSTSVGGAQLTANSAFCSQSVTSCLQPDVIQSYNVLNAVCYSLAPMLIE
jgi:hypothetical protein